MAHSQPIEPVKTTINKDYRLLTVAKGPDFQPRQTVTLRDWKKMIKELVQYTKKA